MGGHPQRILGELSGSVELNCAVEGQRNSSPVAPFLGHVRDLRGVVDREKAEIGVLITLEDATRPMLTEAASADFYKSPWGSHPR